MPNYELGWSNLFLYGLIIYLLFLPVYGGLATSSLEYYAATSKVSAKMIQAFIDQLKRPMSWLFSGNPPLFNRLYMQREDKQKNLIDYLVTIPVEKARPRRRIWMFMASVVVLSDVFGIIRLIVERDFDIPMFIQYLFWFIINIKTWLECFYFGSTLSESNASL